MKATGLTNRQIAELCDLSESRVSVVLNHPDARVLLAERVTEFVSSLTDDLREQIQGAAGEAFQTVVQLMRRAESEKVRQMSAFDILDRAGFKPKDHHVHTTERLEQKDITELAMALRELGQEPEVLEPVSNSVDALVKHSERGSSPPDS
jgi:hypothetical protein